MITTRTLKAGQVLTVTYKGRKTDCFVVKAAGGKGLGFVIGTTEYKSISGAGKSLHGSRSIGGFGFWTLVGENNKTAKKQPAKKTNAQLATDDELAAEVKLAGGAKKVAAAVAAGTPKRLHKKASTKEVA